MAAQKQISFDKVYDRVPPLSSKYLWFVGQNLEVKDGDQIFYTIQNPLCYYRCRIPELIGRRIRECYHGWVILSSHPDMVMWSLWNPVTSRLIRLPPLTHDQQDDSYDSCLSSPPDDPNSIFLLTTAKRATIFFCRLDRKRKKMRWTKMSYAKQLKQLQTMHVTDDYFSEEDGFLGCLTCWNGKVYATTLGFNYYHFLIQIDIVFKDKEVVISLLPIVETPGSFGRHIFYMKGFSTELLYIETAFEDEITNTVGGVSLFKLDMTNMMWEEIKDLEGALLAGGDSVIYSPEIASELSGYIHVLGETGKEIYSYNVMNRTIFLSSMPSLLQTWQVSASTMLECRLGDHQQEEDTDDKKIVRSVRSDNFDFYITTGESHLLNFPFGVLQRIMELCVGVDYMNFRAACKFCRSAAPPIKWSKKTALRRLQMYSLVSPWFVVFDKHQGIITFTDPISSDNYFIKTPPELIDDFQICCSRHGWLLMSKDDGPMVFFNPFTSDIRKFPQAPSNLESYCFSAPPTSPGCIVVGFIKEMEFRVYINLIGSGQVWFELSLDFCFCDPYSFLFPTFRGQDVYALSDNGGIDVFKKLGQEDYSSEVVITEAPISCCRTPVKRYLASCDQHIIQVVMDELGESIELFNLDDSKKEWKKIDGLGKHMIYVCGTTCLCFEARTPEMESKIYFPRLRSKKIVFYSLETCRYHTLNGKNVEESFGNFFGTEYHTFRTHSWIEPSWSYEI